MPRKKTDRHLIDHLTLHSWVNSQFGYETTQALLNDIGRLDEGFTASGHSVTYEYLIERVDSGSPLVEALNVYDSNIKRHLAAINSTRAEPIVLRYFQYLALLYTELYLDWKTNKPAELLRQLNAFVAKRNAQRAPGDAQDTKYEAADLEKIAFWMATGAGKTLIMHINYHQYLHYNKEKLDNIVLITPNEGLTEQHLRELHTSNIPAKRFDVNRSSDPHNPLQVIEITKLVDEKRGGGRRVPVEAFDGHNLVFVDEGHKGASSNKRAWRSYREDLAETGFTFEYSATFGQALAAAGNADLIDEYGKAIAFDYSYRYFYEDGYGKNFEILNVQHDNARQTEILLLGNLLSFYEQRLYFNNNRDVVRAYGLEQPLWTFVGSKVMRGGKDKTVYTGPGGKRSDVLTVIRFLHQVLKNEQNWTIEHIEKILSGTSGLADDTGIDVFANRYGYLREQHDTSQQIYSAILEDVFHTDRSGTLHLNTVQNAKDEIALKTTAANKSFGVIYIGDTNEFLKLVKSETDIQLDTENVIAQSLFDDINNTESDTHILIGARKFIEGWNSWRVTAMGLLNIGQNEGSQIIQLFGRGVRLRGKNMSLKRSAALTGEHPAYIALLETLNIFAVRARFMAQFRKYLMQEGIEDKVKMELPIITNLNFLQKGLILPKAPRYEDVAKGKCLSLKVNTNIAVTHRTQSVEVIASSSQTGITSEQATAAHKKRIPQNILACLNWQRIYLQLIEYKQQKQYYNLVFDTGVLKQILHPENALYDLYVADPSEVTPKTREQLEQVEMLVLTILQKYIAKYYRTAQQRITTENMELETIEENNSNFENWEVRISKNNETLIEQVNKLQEEIEQMKAEGNFNYAAKHIGFPEAFIERHLYQPLLVMTKQKTLEATPPALVESEHEFVKDLRDYLQNPQANVTNENQVYLLRNQSRGKGVGFYDNEGFYPDFILWILADTKQRIVFVEPHGMMHEPINDRSLKINLFKRLREISQRYKSKGVIMDSFIISKTAFRVLHNREGKDREQFANEWHILFTDTDSYLAPIFKNTD